ncbi:hypothetical protein KR054_000018 [Drosophila jambulina]|nr:hypothetical protein KR054_000018 [Drosophila jambulina]
MRPLIVLLLLIVAQVWSSSVPSPRSYDGYSVYRVRIASPSQQQIVDQLLEQHERYNEWHRLKNEVHIMVHPRTQRHFRKIMLDANIDVELIIPNVQM